ncbi:MAG: ribosome small subunit-dependent GTPase A [SAR324 cluster bacterium]|nr:ribosome small subunit-dependent GTPase A [SAR324 cluster bacterium]
MPKQENRQIGTVLKRMKGFYYIDLEGTVCLCRIKGNLFQGKSRKNSVAVGDRVEFDPNASEDAGWIYKVLPRSSELSRPAKEGRIEQTLVSNVDNLLIVSAIKMPAFRTGMVDRFLITAQRGHLHPIIIVNKTDLAETWEIEEIRETYETLGYQILPTSTVSGVGLDSLKALLRKRTSVLSGHSGVGKSSLLKALFPGWEIKIGSVSDTTQKGRHTTTNSEMYRLPDGGYVVDTPGIRELGLHLLSPEDLDLYFVEFQDDRLHCKYKGCSHRHEPHCAVREGVAEKRIAPLRYQSYCSIFDSLLDSSPKKAK